jgi:malonyl CoA-acyl carrier protein transacylase
MSEVHARARARLVRHKFDRRDGQEEGEGHTTREDRIASRSMTTLSEAAVDARASSQLLSLAGAPAGLPGWGQGSVAATATAAAAAAAAATAAAATAATAGAVDDERSDILPPPAAPVPKPSLRPPDPHRCP